MEVLISVRWDIWENLEWKGLTTLDMGPVVLQTAQNLLKPFNLNILNDFMKIEKYVCKLCYICKELVF